MAIGYFKKSLGGLRPIDAMAQELLDNMPYDTTVKVKVTRPRSGPHHRLFFALLSKVHKNSNACERWPDIEDFREIVTIGAGHYRWLELPNGKRESRAKSIAWNKMDQAEFNVFFEAVMDCICNKLKLVEDADLRREFEAMLGDAA